ncbi:MAG TPA: RDD family protein [Chloroflexota bacterium]|nr:RDD family protein [Chloroflexota bacterium]
MPTHSVPLQTKPAGWWQRVGAFVIDVLVLLYPSALLFAFTFVPELLVSSFTNCRGTGNNFHCPTPTGDVGWFVALDAVIVLLTWTAYFAVFNGLVDGRSPGSAATGIAVRDASTGATIGFGRGAARWLFRLALYALGIVPGLVNDLWPLWDVRRQTLADKVCGSLVIRTR